MHHVFFQRATSVIMAAMLLSSLACGALEVAAVLKDAPPPEATPTVWALVFAILAAIWVQRDAEQRRLPVPFEFSFLVYVLLPLALPYHLIRTRGWKGLLHLLGFVLIFVLPTVAGALAYAFVDAG